MARRDALRCALHGAALWPVWAWYVGRVRDGTEEPLCLLALATAAATAARNGRARAGSGRAGWGWAGLLLVAYAVSFGRVPMLATAALGLWSVGATLRGLGLRLGAGWWGLAVLSLPLMSTLQFVAGYPLRALAAGGTAWLLRLAGLGVTTEGTLLRWGDQLVEVDAPCSGVRMLWVGLYAATALAAWAGLPARRTAGVAACAAAFVVAGNAVRAAGLFTLEAGLAAMPGPAHEATGVAAFAMVAMATVAVARRAAE